MPYTLASEHFEFFLKNGFIELENTINESTLDQLKEAFTSHLKEKLSSKTKGLIGDRDAFFESHDLIRKNELLQKKIFNRNFVDIICHLYDIQKPRLGFDQFIQSDLNSESKPPLTDLGFQESSCIFKLRGVLLIALTSITLNDNPMKALPERKGSVTFFKPHFRLSFDPFIKGGSGLYLLVGIGDDKMIYRHIDEDPFVHMLKKEGYVFGDLLKNASHPYLKTS